jgi:nucleoside-diphosphate-sugar epimerase
MNTGTILPSVPAEDLDHVLSHTMDLWEEARGARFFITGGTGFFGIWLLATFAHANDKLGLEMSAVVLTRNPEAFAKKAPQLAGRKDLKFLCGDVRSFDLPGGHFSYVIHAATEASAKLNRDHPQEMFDSIVSGTSHVLSFARDAGVRKFLFTSSGAVYGSQPSDLTHVPETHLGALDPFQSVSAYGIGKLAAEHLCSVEGQASGFEVKVARCFAFVGPHLPLDTHFAVGNFLGAVIRGETPTLTGDGTPRRSFLYASDMAIALWTILFKGMPNRAYNVGSKHDLSINELARAVCCALGREDLSPKQIPQAQSNQRVSRYVPDVSRAEQELNLCGHVPLGEALRKTAAFLGFDKI